MHISISSRIVIYHIDCSFLKFQTYVQSIPRINAFSNISLFIKEHNFFFYWMETQCSILHNFSYNFRSQKFSPPANIFAQLNSLFPPVASQQRQQLLLIAAVPFATSIRSHSQPLQPLWPPTHTPNWGIQASRLFILPTSTRVPTHTNNLYGARMCCSAPFVCLPNFISPRLASCRKVYSFFFTSVAWICGGGKEAVGGSSGGGEREPQWDTPYLIYFIRLLAAKTVCIFIMIMWIKLVYSSFVLFLVERSAFCV